MQSATQTIQQVRVAIVDDDAAVGDSLRFLLETVGHTAKTFESAAQLLAVDLRQIDCLIIDHHMPQMTGLELAAKLRTDGSDVPILLITGAPSPAVVMRAADLGIQVLEKPPSEEDVLAFIEERTS
jgi:two-component system, LuxR family, response regulator FixJ